VATYSYDGRNFRITKTASGTTRHYYFNNAWQCLEERLGASTYANRQYIWGLRYVDDLLLRDRDADGSSATGSLGLSGSGLEERLYCLQDANWNVVGISSTAGAILERYTYTAYGKPTFVSGAFGGRVSSSYAWDSLYTGRRFDAETGFGYFRYRLVQFDLGRFLGRDPIGYEAGDPNLYCYVGDNPLISVDPTGLDGTHSFSVNGYPARVDWAEGQFHLIGGVGHWGQPWTRASGGAIPLPNGLRTSLNLWGHYTCNSILDSFSAQSGTMKAHVKLLCGLYMINWNWSVSGSSDKIGYGTLTIMGGVGFSGFFGKGFPWISEMRSETTMVSVTTPSWVHIATYQPVLQIPGDPNNGDNDPSTMIRATGVLQITNVVKLQ